MTIFSEDMIDQIKELLKRVADSHIVKARARFYSFKELLQ
jgi:hypothetical protein